MNFMSVVNETQMSEIKFITFMRLVNSILNEELSGQLKNVSRMLIVIGGL